MSELNNEQKRVVEDILNHRRSGPIYRLSMSISFQVNTDREQERQQKEETLQKLLHDHFPHWVVPSRFKHHPAYSLFPGLYCATINSTDKWLSLIASAYFEKWKR